MNPLTKIFVVLLVVVSILQSAATVVWVNNIQPLQATLNQATNSQRAAESGRLQAEQQLQQAQDDTAKANAATSAQKDKDNVIIVQSQSKISQDEVQLAQDQKDLATKDAQIIATSSQNTLLTATNGNLQKTVNDLRTNNDTLVKNNADNERHIADLSADVESLRAHLDDKTAQLADAANNVQRLEGLLKDHGIDPATALAGGQVPGFGAPAINGSISDIANTNGVTFVTINVGQQDGVVSGMKFWVVDGQKNKVLGTVTVNSVEPTQSIGKIQAAPADVSQIQKGDDVKTLSAIKGQ